VAIDDELADLMAIHNEVKAHNVMLGSIVQDGANRMKATEEAISMLAHSSGQTRQKLEKAKSGIEKA